MNSKHESITIEAINSNVFREEKYGLKTNLQKEVEIKRKNSIFQNLLSIIIMAIIGFFFGFILEKSKVYEPKFIRQQMI
ncbi:hypothetical protein BpHYR1_052539, partial [Brachionus plicatilis]